MISVVLKFLKCKYPALIIAFISVFVFSGVNYVYALNSLFDLPTKSDAPDFPTPPQAPVVNFNIPQPPVIPNHYIVVLNDNVLDSSQAASEILSKVDGQVQFEYNKPIKGFSAIFDDNKLSLVKEDPRVKFVAQDREVAILSHKTKPLTTSSVQETPTGISRILVTQNTNKGDGIGVAILDTGIYLSHSDLKNNIIANKTCILGTRSGNDDNGHGTHVAGIVAAENNSVGVIGVAPGAKLIAVKVLNSRGSGTWSSVICGIDWVTANAAKYNIKVANMSLGGGGTSDNNCGSTNNDPLHQAICRSTAAGITYVVAAGNSGADAQNTVPAAYDDTLITVSALADSDGLSGGSGQATSYGSDDTFATFSNFGSVVDLGAPGVNIKSTWKGGGYKTISGTSMASPHVAGATALYIRSNPSFTWQQVRDGLKTAGEALGFGHMDLTGNHPEPVVKADLL